MSKFHQTAANTCPIHFDWYIVWQILNGIPPGSSVVILTKKFIAPLLTKFKYVSQNGFEGEALVDVPTVSPVQRSPSIPSKRDLF